MILTKGGKKPMKNYRIHPHGGGLVAETAQVDDTVYLGPYVKVKDLAKISGLVKIRGKVLISDSARILGDVDILGINLKISEQAWIFSRVGKVKILGFGHIYGNPRIFGNVKIYGIINICEEVDFYKS